MRVFLTGVHGYIGSVLAPLLMSRGVEVVGLDTGFYRDGWLFSDDQQLAVTPQTLNKDLRLITASDLAGFDAVVHLAELSNDPLGENRPEVTFKINHEGSVALAKLARAAGSRRFVYASSCSVYGAGTGDFLDETAPPNPQTAYARCKVMVERDVGAMAGPDFAPVFLRNATAYGASPRMRFDIVINDLCALAWTTRRIAMTSDGSPWRPVAHVRDICEAVYQCLVAPAEAIGGQIFNVGANEENYRVRELGEIVAAVFPGCELSFGKPSGDTRSYRVRFDKIRAALPQFRCAHTARSGAMELRRLFERIQMSPETYQFRAFTRLKQLRYLQNTHQIDDEFFWSTM
jgi:nucleoside-diphosphate-sugar epimerase